MVYSNKLVVVVKCNGRVLRERGDVVTLPFGSEYSLLVKNLDSRRASVKISIDGKDTLYGYSLIVEPNSETELMGFMQGSIVRHRFKFIQKTKQVQSHRGDRTDDGLIRIEFAFEKRATEVTRRTILTEEVHVPRRSFPPFSYYYDYHPPIFGHSLHWTENGPGFSNDGTAVGENVQVSNTMGMSEKGASGVQMSEQPVANYCCQVDQISEPAQDEGITVEGSRINQHFQYASIGALEQSEVVILRLRGIQSDGEQVSEPITVKTKLECPTCGKKSSSGAKFCQECGTSLII